MVERQSNYFVDSLFDGLITLLASNLDSNSRENFGTTISGESQKYLDIFWWNFLLDNDNEFKYT